MSTKAWVTSGADFSLYHDLTLDDEEPNDVYLELDDARELLVGSNIENCRALWAAPWV